MTDTVLIASFRSEMGSRPSGRLRRSGNVPGVIYGLGGDNLLIMVSDHALSHMLAGGANTLITLRLDGKDQLALARQVQRHPVKGNLVHVDFVRVRVDQTVTAEVALHLVGEAEGVRGGGLLEQLLFSLSVAAKPGDIPTSFEHDVSEMILGDQLHIRDLAVPAEVMLAHVPEELVAQVTTPRGADAGADAAEGESPVDVPGESAETTGE